MVSFFLNQECLHSIQPVYKGARIDHTGEDTVPVQYRAGPGGGSDHSVYGNSQMKRFPILTAELELSTNQAEKKRASEVHTSEKIAAVECKNRIIAPSLSNSQTGQLFPHEGRIGASLKKA